MQDIFDGNEIPSPIPEQSTDPEMASSALSTEEQQLFDDDAKENHAEHDREATPTTPISWSQSPGLVPEEIEEPGSNASDTSTTSSNESAGNASSQTETLNTMDE